MKKKLIFSSFVIITLLAGCGILPNPGPSGSEVEHDAKTSDISVITVTPDMAAHMRQTIITTHHQEVIENLNKLRNLSRRNIQTKLLPGDEFSIQVFMMPLLPSGNSSASSDIVSNVYNIKNNVLQNNGSVTIPFAGTVNLNGITIQQAERILQIKYNDDHVFNDAQVLVKIQNNRAQGVLVTGYAANPKHISWRPGGITLADALVDAKGFSTNGLAHSKSSTGKNRTVVINENHESITLPGLVAESSVIPLLPGATIALNLQVKDHVLCIGGGITTNAALTFAKIPSLATVLARAGGLNPQTAKAQSVFVLTPDHKVVYRFYLDHLSGLQAAQDFPVRNRSVIYASTAPSVHLQQAMQILFSPFYPAAAIKGVA